MMRLLIRDIFALVVICLGTAPWNGVAFAKDDVPGGYEDAAPAAQPAAQKKTPAGSVPARVPPAQTPAARKTAETQRDEKTKPAEAPQGYEDAPVAKKTPAAAHAAPAAAQPVIDAANPRVVQMVQQYRPQYQRLLKAENAFMCRACQPDAAEKAAFAKLAEECMTGVLQECALAQVRMEQGGEIRPNAIPDAPSLLRTRLMEVAKKTLRPDRAEQYRRETELRAASRRRAMIDYMVARADELLVLSPEQRRKLTDALTKHYSNNWERHLSIWMNNTQLAPSIPDSQIQPLLSPEQQTVWTGLNKLGDCYWGIDTEWVQFIENE